MIHFFFFFFNDTATTEIYTLSLHDALPISPRCRRQDAPLGKPGPQQHYRTRPRQPGPFDLPEICHHRADEARVSRSEEHTSELQSRRDLVCRLLLEKKKRNNDPDNYYQYIQ